ncbi:secretin N-terminal domain-containing protein [Neorhodopirellula lusitana]|uniref:secretin N-terminal domain-containing protein n=1 Tax=Neorhodopirellula lusitana TaxID=445327 RepID=UPI00384C0755
MERQIARISRFAPAVRNVALLFASVLGGCIALSTVAHGERPNAPELRQLNVPMPLVESISTRLNLHYHGEVGVSITADDRVGADGQSGAILVMASPEQHQRIAADTLKLIQRLEPEMNSASKSTATVHLIHITWRETEDALRVIAGTNTPFTTSRNGEKSSFQIKLQGAAGSSTQFEVDRRTNQLTMTTNASSLEAWQKFIAALDRPARFRGERTHVHHLINADAAPVQRAIRLMRELDASTSHSSRKDRPVSNRKDSAQFRTAAFQSNGTSDQSGTQSAEVATTEDGAITEGGVIGDTDIQIIPDSGLIIVKGAEKDVQRIKKVIAEIEAQAKLTQPEVEVRQLEHADANAVAALLSQLYEDVLSARQGEVSITSLDAPNALLLIGRAEAIKAVVDLISKIDQPIPETDRLRVFRLQHASATDAETTIRDFFTNQPGGDSDNRPGLGNRVRISADYRTNSLVIGASPRDMAEVTRLITDLDVQDIPSSSQIKVFPLRNARAEDLAPVLQDAISGEPDDVPGDTTTPASTLSIVALGAGDGATGDSVLDSGILTGALVTADNNANAIIVRAPAAGLPLIAELIRQLDQAPGIDSLVKVFTIENGDAAQLTTALQSLFGDDAATSGTSIGAGNQAGLPALSASPSALVPLRFSTDIRTNSIIVSGSAEDLEVVESILLRLDSTGFSERITEVIWLKNQIAANIATAIQDYVTQRQQFQNIIPQFQTGLGPMDLPDRDVIVVAEAQTNSLLISVSPRLYEDVRRLIDRLDRRPPMILIKTMIAEVVLEDGFEIGGEFGLQDSILFDRGKATTGADPGDPGFNFGGTSLPNESDYSQEKLAAQGLTSFNAAASQISDLGSGGFVFSAASESINVFMRTLQIANRLQILSRPEIMTADNTEGFVQVGQDFPRPTDIQVTGTTGQTLIGIEDVPIGIILRVVPRVGADGMILMDIDASRSDVNFSVGQNIGTTSDGTPIFVPAIDTTNAQATVTAFDGQTVVFGGLITKRRSNFSRKVPYLGDIPVLGTFFKYEGEEERRTELLIVMTPTLVTGHEDLEYVKQVESSRMSWCLADVVEAHGDVGLSGGYGLWGPAIGPTIYPDMHPTVDVFPAADLPRSVAERYAPTGNGVTANRSVPAGIQLGPGESIVDHADMIHAESYPQSYGSGVVTPAEPVIIPEPIQNANPQGSLPAPSQELLPVPQASVTPKASTGDGMPASGTSTSSQASTTRWSKFNARLSSFKK